MNPLRLLALLAVASPAMAFDFAVTRYDDPSPSGCTPTDCSLREAVIAANANPGADRILLSAGIYQLTRLGNQEDDSHFGDLDILDDLEILGVAANLTIIDATHQIERAIDLPQVLELTVRLSDLSVIRGSGTFHPGAIRAFRANLLIERCEIWGNLGAAPSVTMGVFGSLTLRDSTIRDNGGGVGCSQSDCLLENVTLSDNGSAELRGTNGAVITCRHCTVFDELFGSVIELDLAALELSNSVVQGQCVLANAASFVFTGGGNLESPGQTCSLDGPDDVDDVFTSALLDLAMNGGATWTRRPQVGGPSDNNAHDANCQPAFDQTGLPRPQSQCDRGAVETAPHRTLIPIFIDGFQQGDAEAWSGVAP